MIEKIQQVEDNWQKPWITIAANTRNFFPQNLTGRRYTGGNAFLLLFLCEKFQYQTPVFMTFNQAKEAGISVLKGSKSFPVYYFLFYVYHKETRKKITFEEYKALSREQQQEYNVIPTYSKRLLNYILCIRFFIEVHSIVSASRFFHMPTYLRVVIECQSRFFPFFPAFSRNCPDYFLHTSGSSSFRSLSDLGAR